MPTAPVDFHWAYLHHNNDNTLLKTDDEPTNDEASGGPGETSLQLMTAPGFFLSVFAYAT